MYLCQRRIQNPVKHLRWAFREHFYLICMTGSEYVSPCKANPRQRQDLFFELIVASLAVSKDILPCLFFSNQYICIYFSYQIQNDIAHREDTDLLVCRCFFIFFSVLEICFQQRKSYFDKLPLFLQKQFYRLKHLHLALFKIVLFPALM